MFGTLTSHSSVPHALLPYLFYSSPPHPQQNNDLPELSALLRAHNLLFTPSAIRQCAFAVLLSLTKIKVHSIYLWRKKKKRKKNNIWLTAPKLATHVHWTSATDWQLYSNFRIFKDNDKNRTFMGEYVMWIRSGTGSTHPREDNWVATWMKSSGSYKESRHY